MPKILVVFGTRPDAIKMAPVVKVLSAARGIDVGVCVTAQHRSMLDSVLETFELEPDYDLNVMRHNQDLIDVAARALGGMKEVVRSASPDLVLVHGDTTTAFCAGLASFYEGFAIGHVEAGLRTNDLLAPWPEEANRQLITRIARFHFAPTKAAADNLRSEGVDNESIIVTGNTVIDALLWMNRKLDDDTIREQTSARITANGYQVSPDRSYVLVTGHRRENIGAGIRNICAAVCSLARRFPEMDFVYPVHLNPRVRGTVMHWLEGRSNVKLLPPLDYSAFVLLMRNSRLVLTDSGGIQEEAPALGKPVLVMRDTTERTEAVEAGTLRLVGTESDAIEGAVTELLENEDSYRKMAQAVNPYGDGRAASRIKDFILTI